MTEKKTPEVNMKLSIQQGFNFGIGLMLSVVVFVPVAACVGGIVLIALANQ